MAAVESQVLAFIKKNPNTSVAEIAWGIGRKTGLNKDKGYLEGAVDAEVLDAARLLTAQGKIISLSAGIRAL